MVVDKASKERTKVVLRHIPPGFDSESMLALLTTTLHPFPKYDFYHFSYADYSLNPYLSCRAYVNFVEPESAFAFKDTFDGQKFIDSNKVQMVGIVEYAPFQRVPKRLKKDVRSGTIENDPEYLEFLEELKIEPEAPPSIETIIDEIEKRRIARAEEQSSTALLEYIKLRRAERSLSPHGKSQFRRDRAPKYDDNRRYKGARSHRHNSEEDNFRRKCHSEPDDRDAKSTDKPTGRSGSSNEEYRSRNNVKSERSGKSYVSKGMAEKEFYVPGKKKIEENTAKYILSSNTKSINNEVHDKKERLNTRETSENDSKSSNYNNNSNDRDRYGSQNSEDRQSYRREGYNESKKSGRGERDYNRDRDRDFDRDDDYYSGGYRGSSYRGSRGYRGDWREDRGRGRGRSRGRSSRARH